MLPLRPNVCLIIINSDGDYFLAERFGCSGIWQFPQGGVEEGMSVVDTALKEAHEELGVPMSSFSFVKQLYVKHDYEFSEPVPKRYMGKWRGQSQNFVILKFNGKDEDIKLDAYEQELMNWKWCSIADVRTLAEPKRLVGYELAFRELGI